MKRSHTHTQWPKASAELFPGVYTHTHTHTHRHRRIQKITGIAAYPMFMKRFQGERRASGVAVQLFVSRGTLRRPDGCRLVLFSPRSFSSPSDRSPGWMPPPQRSAVAKATLNNKEGSNGTHGFDDPPPPTSRLQ